MEIKIINESSNSLPSYSTEGSSGLDVKADFSRSENKKLIIPSLGRALIPTGLFVAIPDGYEIQVRPRSGLAIKNGITVLNTPGTIDADYRGEIKIILFNTSNSDFVVSHGDKIAQIVLTNITKVKWLETDSLEDSDRGANGFGSTGK